MKHLQLMIARLALVMKRLQSAKYLQPAALAVIALLLLGLTAFNAQSGVLQKSLSAALFSGSPSTSDSTQASDTSEVAALRIADDLEKAEAQKPKTVDSETLWLARVIYSETKQPHEQELIAWVVRNRVETNYRGNTSYREAVLDPYQFSAFNPGSRKRAHYTNLGKNSRQPGWQRAIEIAQEVRHASSRERPFTISTRHFYSERSMVGRSQPSWANGKRANYAINREYNVDQRRFRFFDGVL